MPAELGTISRFPCPFTGCRLSFKSQGDYHRHRDMEHEHCKKCDLDFEDWEAFVQHKAQSDKHISCPSCGADFKSHDGLKRHIQQNHQRAQKLVCHGCNGIFTKPGAFMAHIEQNKCVNKEDKAREIKKSDLDAHFHRKIILEHYLNKPQPFNGAPSQNVAPSLSTAFTKLTVDNEDGGVQIDGSTTEHFPQLRPQGTPAFARRSALDGASSDTSLEKNWDATSNDGKTDVVVDKLADDQHDNKLVTSTTAGPWSGASGSRLFPNAKPNPEAQTFEEGLAARETQYDQRTNMFHSKFWDPNERSFNPEVFFNQVIERYECPYPACEFITMSPSALTRHLHDQEKHAVRSHRCPACLKLFKTASALVDHCDSPVNRCWIRKTDDYAKHIDKITGGYVSVVRQDEEEEDAWGSKFEVTKPVFGW